MVCQNWFVRCAVHPRQEVKVFIPDLKGHTGRWSEKSAVIERWICDVVSPGVHSVMHVSSDRKS